MIAFEEHKAKLNDLKPKLDALADSLGLEPGQGRAGRLHAQAASEGFWDNLENSQKVLQKTKQLETKIESYEKMQTEWETSIPSARWRWRKMTAPCWTSCSPALKRWNR